MNKLVIVFVAFFVAAIAAAPNVKVTNLEPLEHVKRAATLLMPLQTINEQKKATSRSDISDLITLIDVDHDGMLNVNELQVLLRLGGTPRSDLKSSAIYLMGRFDHDQNGKLDLNETEEIVKVPGL